MDKIKSYLTWFVLYFLFFIDYFILTDKKIQTSCFWIVIVLFMIYIEFIRKSKK
jgi:hypothetical protein